MGKSMKILGKIIKWFFLIEAVAFVIIIFTEIVKLSFEGIGIYILSVLTCLLIAYAGYRIERFGKSKEKSAVKKKSAVKEQYRQVNSQTETAPAPEPVYKPVSDRRGTVSNGEFIYEFKNRKDLFPDGEAGLAYPELPWNFQIAANLGRHILDSGGLITGIYIGGGCDEVSHTGAVAYGHSYGTLESFVEKSMAGLEAAESEASMKYGCWFTGLDYKYIIIRARIKETDIKVEVSCFVSSIAVSIRLEKGSEGLSYLTDLVSRFGAKDFDQGVGADKLSWDASLKILRRTYQLEESRTYFLSSFMDTEGNFTKYSLDEETAEDSHYEILPEKMEQLTRILKEEMNQKYLRDPAVSCAYYLQHHDGRELIALLKSHQLINKEFHYD